MTPEQQAIIIHERARNVPGSTIAQSLGVHPSTVSRAQQELRPLIEAETQKLLTTCLANARKTTEKLTAYGASEQCVPGETDVAWAKLSHDASKSIIALIASSQPGMIINQLIQINQAPEQTAEVSAIQQFLAAQWQGSDTGIEDRSTSDVIDVPTPHTPEHVQGVNAPGEIQVESVDNPVDVPNCG